MSVRGLQAAGLLLLPLLGFAAFEEVRDLRSARVERAIAERAARPAVALAADGVAMTVSDPAAAKRALAKLLADRASAAAIRLATASIGADPIGHFAATEVVAIGGETAILRFITELESGRPTVRFSRWTLTPTTDGLRLAARAEALWQTQNVPKAGVANAIRVPAPTSPVSIPAGMFAPATTSKAGSGFPAELVGIVGRIAVDPQALLKLANGNTRTVAIGETVEGWTLARIDADRVQFRRGVEERTLVLPAASD